MRPQSFRALVVFAVVLLGSSAAFAQMAPAHDHAGGPGGGPGGGGHGMMGHGGGSRGGEDCDSDDCPMKHHGGMMGMGGHGDDDGPNTHWGMFEHMADELGLPDATRKKIADLVYEAKKQGIALRADLEQAKLELHRLMEQDKPDTEAILKQFDKVGQVKNELAKLRLRTMLQVQQLLTPEQRKKARSHMMMMMMHGGED